MLAYPCDIMSLKSNGSWTLGEKLYVAFFHFFLEKRKFWLLNLPSRLTVLPFTGQSVHFLDDYFSRNLVCSSSKTCLVGQTHHPLWGPTSPGKRCLLLGRRASVGDWDDLHQWEKQLAAVPVSWNQLSLYSLPMGYFKKIAKKREKFSSWLNSVNQLGIRRAWLTWEKQGKS